MMLKVCELPVGIRPTQTIMRRLDSGVGIDDGLKVTVNENLCFPPVWGRLHDQTDAHGTLLRPPMTQAEVSSEVDPRTGVRCAGRSPTRPTGAVRCAPGVGLRYLQSLPGPLRDVRFPERAVFLD
jgi:hypothetical protein